MIKSISCLLFCFFISILCIGQDIEQALSELPGVEFELLKPKEGFEAIYKLSIQQPLDHKDPSKGHFDQKVYLSHRGLQSPTVLITQGYGISWNNIYELTNLLEANQVNVEHRFFGNSMPDSLDYDYLNLAQATADLHHINQLLRPIYEGKWVSTGISKGGATTIFYRYYFPDDVDASVPYVAPINLGFEEQRIYTFLDTVGSDECRLNLLALQKRVLQNREEVLPMFHFYSKGAKLEYTYLSPEEAFEYAVLEFPFSFWQWGGKCEDIPGDDASIKEDVEYLLDISGPDFFADKSMTNYASHYFQSAEEMGYYGYETKNFEGLLTALPLHPNPHAAFTPNHMEVPFDGQLLDDVNAWLLQDADAFIYINGALDTWSASAVRPNEVVDALWFMMADKHHGNARIRNMNSADQERLIAALERWLELEIDPAAIRTKK